MKALNIGIKRQDGSCNITSLGISHDHTSGSDALCH